jgi:hypothetical protein
MSTLSKKAWSHACTRVLSIRLKFQDMIYDPATAGGVTPRFTTPPIEYDP